MPAKKTTTARKAGQAKKKVAKRVAKTVSKKPTKKAAAKKKTTKKTVREAVRKRATKKSCACNSRCSKDEAFWVNNGPVIHSLQDLLDALKEMTDEQFEHHAKNNGNDFANWIKECLKDGASATSVKRVRTRVGAVRVLSNKCSCK